MVEETAVAVFSVQRSLARLRHPQEHMRCSACAQAFLRDQGSRAVLTGRLYRPYCIRSSGWVQNHQLLPHATPKSQRPSVCGECGRQAHQGLALWRKSGLFAGRPIDTSVSSCGRRERHACFPV